MNISLTRPYILLFAPVVIIYIIFLYRKSGRNGASLILPYALKTGAFLLALFMLAGLKLTSSSIIPKDGLITLLVDRSASMNIKLSNVEGAGSNSGNHDELPEDTASVPEKAENTLRSARAIVKKLPASVEHRIILFDVSTTVVADAEKLTYDYVRFDGSGTDIHEALKATLDREGANSHVVLLSDGRHNGSEKAEELAARISPRLHIIPIGDVDSIHDISLSSLKTDDISFAGEELFLKLNIRSSFMEKVPVPLALYRNNSLIDRTMVEIKPGVNKIELSDVPDKTGASIYRVEISPPGNDSVSTNNELAASVNIIKSKISVFLYGSSTGSDFSYLLRALSMDREINLKWTVRAGSRWLGNTEGLPDLKEKEKPELLILHDPDYSDMDEEWIENLKGLISKDGMGLILIAGKQTAASGKRMKSLWKAMPLRPKMPAHYRENWQPVSFDHTYGLLRIHSRPDISSSIWRNVPPVSSGYTNIERTAGAAVFAHNNDEPAAAVHYFGKGRTMSIMTDSLWRAGFAHQSAGNVEPVTQFWRQAVRMTASSTERGTPVSINLPEGPVPARSTPDVEVNVRDERGNPLSDASVTIEANGIQYKAVHNGNGVYSTRLEPVYNGTHQIRASARAGGVVLGAAEATLIVSNAPGELDVLTVNRDYLSSLGRLWEPGNEQELIDHIVKSIGEHKVEITSKASDNTLVIIVLILLLCSEWLIRKIRGFDVMILLILLMPTALAQNNSISNTPLPESNKGVFSIARLKYDGGGDWYNDPSVITNMLSELKSRTGMDAAEEQSIVSPGERALFDHLFVYITGHGNIAFSPEERENLREYVSRGGFIYIDDDYGMDNAARREIRLLFPENELIQLPAEHPIFSLFYRFPKGLPKIHEHDGKAPEALAIVEEGRIVLLYTYESNISDGWASPDVHNTPESLREQAFRFGVNMILYALLSWGGL